MAVHVQVEVKLQAAMEQTGRMRDGMVEAYQQLKAADRELKQLGQRQAQLQKQHKVGP